MSRMGHGQITPRNKGFRGILLATDFEMSSGNICSLAPSTTVIRLCFCEVSAFGN